MEEHQDLAEKCVTKEAALASAIPTKDNTASSPITFAHINLLPSKPSGSPSPDKTRVSRVSLTPEGRRYKVLYEQLKVKYRQQEKAYNRKVDTLSELSNKIKESEVNRMSLNEQLTNITTENEELRQKLEASNTNGKSAEESTNENLIEGGETPLNQTLATTQLCNEVKCIDDEDQYKFECIKCKKLFHYRCTNLPTYQIAHFLTTNYRRYICINCTKIPEYVTGVMKDHAPPPTIRKTSRENTDVSNDTIASLKTFLSEQVTKIENNLKGMIEFKLGENKKEITALNENLSKVRPPSPTSTAENQLDPTERTPIAWSTVVGRNQDIKTLMRDARNDEKIEESEKERRAKNIIIHGAEEVGKSPDEIKIEDGQYVREIFKKIGSSSEPTLITRLGEPNDTKSRPIKIVMKTTADKDTVMKNLCRLKGTERFFGKISVKDDYTTQEREEIRLLTERAKKQSNDNLERIFKVRGNSKNGWRVMSFPKEK